MKLNARILAIVFAGIVMVLAIYWKGDVKAALRVSGVELSLEAKEPTHAPALPHDGPPKPIATAKQ